MLNGMTVFILYCGFYLTFTLLGLGIARFVFQPRIYLAHQLSPVLGLTVFCLFSTTLMYYMPGSDAGKTGLLLTFLLNLTLCYITFNGQPKKTMVALARQQRIPFLSGLFFLLPLFVTGDIGIFAINGADFGSYAGWGEYFQDYTLKETTSRNHPVNSTLKAFINLQNEITQPDGRWRIGNISLFTALRALISNQLWPTFYTIAVAFLIAQFVVAIQLFARIVLFQRLKNTLRLSILSIFLSTLVWLAASHYIPNIVGISFTLMIISITLLFNRFNPRLMLGSSILLGGLILIYPESFAFFPFILFFQLIFRDPLLNRRAPSISILKSRTLLAGIALALSMGMAFIWTYESFFYCFRHFFNILGYSRPGDFVGIYPFAYPSQGIGFIDYNAVLRNGKNIWLHALLLINYIASFLLLIYGIKLKAENTREKLKNRTYIVLLGSLVLLLIPICLYFMREQYLIAWRALLTISPYTWLLICIAALNAIALLNKKPVLASTKMMALCFIVLFASTIGYRVLMIKNIAFGSMHAAIFGEAFQKSTAYLQTHRQSYDIAFIDYEGTGTIQGGWEFYSQNLPYIFPQHGIGHNEYDVSPLNNKRIVILSDTYKKVHRLKGFIENSSTFQGRTVSFSNNNNVLQPYSSSWIYLSHEPALLLPGLPGKLLLWLSEDSKACLNLSVKSSRENAILRITFNENRPIQKTITEANTEKLCHEFKKGLNTIRLEPIFLNAKLLQAQQELVNALTRITPEKQTEDEMGLLKLYTLSFLPVNPLSSPTPEEWNTRWNLMTPKDTFPLNPHLIFQKIEVEKVARSG